MFIDLKNSTKWSSACLFLTLHCKTALHNWRRTSRYAQNIP